jgi:hypothetical protein
MGVLPKSSMKAKGEGKERCGNEWMNGRRGRGRIMKEGNGHRKRKKARRMNKE